MVISRRGLVLVAGVSGRHRMLVKPMCLDIGAFINLRHPLLTLRLPAFLSFWVVPLTLLLPRFLELLPTEEPQLDNTTTWSHGPVLGPLFHLPLLPSLPPPRLSLLFARTRPRPGRGGYQISDKNIPKWFQPNRWPRCV